MYVFMWALPLSPHDQQRVTLSGSRRLKTGSCPLQTQGDPAETFTSCSMWTVEVVKAKSKSAMMWGVKAGAGDEGNHAPWYKLQHAIPHVRNQDQTSCCEAVKPCSPSGEETTSSCRIIKCNISPTSQHQRCRRNITSYISSSIAYCLCLFSGRCHTLLQIQRQGNNERLFWISCIILHASVGVWSCQTESQ